MCLDQHIVYWNEKLHHFAYDILKYILLKKDFYFASEFSEVFSFVLNWQLSSIGSGNWLVPFGNMLSLEPMLAEIYGALWLHYATRSLSCLSKLHDNIPMTS